MKRNLVILAVIVAAVILMLVAGQRAGKKAALGIGARGEGSLAPDFELPTTDGKTLKLSDYRGKAVLVNFWATWCGPCKIEMPWFVELQEQYGPQGLQIIGVSVDEGPREDVVKFAQEMKLNYPIVYGSNAVADSYGGVPGLPTSFYVDRNGRIVATNSGLVSHSEIVKNIEKALAGAQPTMEEDGQPARKVPQQAASK